MKVTSKLMFSEKLDTESKLALNLIVIYEFPVKPFLLHGKYRREFKVFHTHCPVLCCNNGIL
jgi:hypothetical protein